MNIEIIVAAFLSGLIGAMGLGGGGVLLIYLTIFANTNQLQAQGMNLLFFLPIGLLAIITYAFKKQIAWRIVLKMWLGGVLGALLGYFVARGLSTDILSKIFGVFLVIFGSFSLLSKEKHEKIEKDA